MSTPNPNTPPPIRAGVSDDEIRQYLTANPNLSDRDIAKAMNQYGVTAGDVSRATGVNMADVVSRYNAAMGESGPVEVSPTHPPIERPPGFDDMNSAMKKYAVDTELAATERAQAERPKKEFALSQKAPSKRLTTADGLDFQPMSAASPMTTLSARGGTRLMKKGGAAKKMTKSKW